MNLWTNVNPSGHRDKEHLLLYGTLIMCPADMGAAGVARRERNVHQALSNKGTWLKRVTQTQNPDPTPLCSRTGWADTLKGVTHAQMSNIARNMEQRFRSVGRIRTRGENNHSRPPIESMCLLTLHIGYYTRMFETTVRNRNSYQTLPAVLQQSKIK